MVNKQNVLQQLQIAHERLSQQDQPPLCFVGFDGFTDEIIRVVDQRLDTQTFEPIYTISDFGRRIIAAAGKSCNLELVPLETRIGGNAPLCTQALLQGGHRIVFAGAIGQRDHIEPIFRSMTARCERVIPLSPSGHTDALEFYDGKVLLGKIGALSEVNYESLIAQLPEDELIKLLDQVDLFVSANWTMLPHLNELWEKLIHNIIPKLPSQRTRYLFVDLADTTKRTAHDLRRALQLLPQFQPAFQVILGLNHAEAQQVYHALIGAPPGPGVQQVEWMARSIRQQSQVSQVVVHATRYAVAVTATETARVEGPYCEEPKITTGGGDNFNAGYCNGLLYGLSLEGCLLTGVSTSGYYVRMGSSPSIQELSTFIQQWDALGAALDRSSKSL
jgi:hypothetical protein